MKDPIGFYMDIAQLVAKQSYCKRRQVGAVLVSADMKNIIAFGYNGTPSGFENVCEEEVIESKYNDQNILIGAERVSKTKSLVLHAESNAITKVAQSTMSSINSHLFTTTAPCIECSKLIIQAGIIEVIYEDDYHTSEGIELLKKAGIAVHEFIRA